MNRKLIILIIGGGWWFLPLLPHLACSQTSAGREFQRQHYQIQIVLDFDARSYRGFETVRWVNRDDHPASVIYFHLYSNLRTLDTSGPVGAQLFETEEPRLEISEVRTSRDGPGLNYSLEEQSTVLRIGLREPVLPGSSAEVFIGFKGTVPEVDAEETGLTTHVVKQVSAVLRAEREVRRARDLNFRSRGVMLLGTAYPVLAVRDGDDWQRKLEPGVGDLIFNETADYAVSIEASSGVTLFTSGSEAGSKAKNDPGQSFSGEGLRDFAILAGRALRSEELQVGDVKLRSVFLPEHERIGKRVLVNAADALRLFQSKFGDLPVKTLNVAEAPLVAGFGSTEFSGMDIIASAFYVDFDAPSVRNLPEIIREQRPSVEESLEWSVAHLISHQWWGGAVGNNPAREPVLDESLASWSALLYFHERYGAQKTADVLDDQLRGVYRLYRTFGGPDMDADRPARDYQNSFQYSALVNAKGALMFVELQRLLGTPKLLAALQNYYRANRGEIAELDDLRAAIVAETPVEQRRLVSRTLARWLSSKRGDEDIAGPDQQLANSLGLPEKSNARRGNDRHALSALARVGKFFWQQMTRIR